VPTNGLAVSGSPLVEAKEEALVNGAFAFIRKPVDPAELDRFVLLALLLALKSRKGNRRYDSHYFVPLG
jgi:hypothetical protein